MSLTGETVVITGAAGNLGVELVEKILDEGCTAVCLDKIQLPTRIRGIPRVFFKAVDLTDGIATEKVIDEAVALTGPPVALINAAGIIHNEPLIGLRPALHTHSVASFKEVMASHLDCAFNTTSSVVARMVSARKRGVIINVGSVNSVGVAGQSAYSAAKAGLKALTRVWSKELGPFGIRSVCIEPGYIDTPGLSQWMSDSELQKIKDRTPTSQLVAIRDVASMIVCALTTESLNGTAINIDMGLAQ